MTIPTNKRTNAAIKSLVVLFMEAIIRSEVRATQLSLVRIVQVGKIDKFLLSEL